MSAGSETAATAIRQWLKENVTGTQEVSDEYPLIANGILTSLQTLDLVLFLEDRLGVAIDDEDLTEKHFGSIHAISDLVRRKLD
ncbi:MAG: acyl carrier protein [Chloroflexota bacterium]|nr:acyl carrier protein [Chloroflexota bacterium]